MYSNIQYPDTHVLHDGHPSIRLEPSVGSENPYREIDLNYVASPPYQDIQVKPGDHVVFTCWIRIEDNGIRNDYAGARIGIDLNGVATISGVLGRVNSGISPTAGHEVENYVHYGTVGWVQRTIDFVIPLTTFTYDCYRGITIAPTQISQIGPWMQVWGPQGPYAPGNAWFADAELYINP
jgi:hypothetical protein